MQLPPELSAAANRVISEMKSAAQRAKQGELSSSLTHQKSVLSLIDALLNPPQQSPSPNQQQAQKQPSPQDQTDSQKNQDQRTSSQSQPDQQRDQDPSNQPNPKSGSNANPEQETQQSGVANPDFGTKMEETKPGSAMDRLRRAAWGHLPPEVRKRTSFDTT